MSKYEGHPKALLEAMACGCICIGTDVSGINEVIKNDVNGYLIPHVEADYIKNTICDLFSKDNKLIQQKAINTIKNDYSINTVLEQEKNVMEKYGI